MLPKNNLKQKENDSDKLLNEINNILKNITCKFNGKETNLKNLNEEIFGLENFTKNLNSKLEIINEIFSQNQIPEIKIEEFRDLILKDLFDKSNMKIITKKSKVDGLNEYERYYNQKLCSEIKYRSIIERIFLMNDNKLDENNKTKLFKDIENIYTSIITFNNNIKNSTINKILITNIDFKANIQLKDEEELNDIDEIEDEIEDKIEGELKKIQSISQVNIIENIAFQNFNYDKKSSRINFNNDVKKVIIHPEGDKEEFYIQEKQLTKSEDKLLNEINNRLKNITLEFNGEKKNLKDLNEEIFGLENFEKNLSPKLEIINEIFSQNQIPKIKIEKFRDLILNKLFKDSGISTNAKKLNENKLNEKEKEKLFQNIGKLYTNYITFDKSISNEVIINCFLIYSTDTKNLITNKLNNTKDDKKNEIKNISFEPFEEIIIDCYAKIFPQKEQTLS